MCSFNLLGSINSYTIRMNFTCIVTALPAESRVFIDAFKLRPILDHGWRLYGNSEHLLLQTGLGKLKAAAAVSALLHTRQDIRTIINAGIVGGSAQVGTTFLAHQIIDGGSMEKWYPHLPPQRVVDSIPTLAIETLDKPSSEYRAEVLFDMEAAGIMSAASYYLSTDAVQFVKVISDNNDAPIETFNPATVTTLMQATVPIVKNITQWYAENKHISELSLSIAALHESIVASVHHTSTEKHQLLRLLQQHHALAGVLPSASELLNATTGSQLIKLLKTINAAFPLTYGNKQ